MAHTAFILILTSDPSRGERLRELIRTKHGHPCRVVASLADALDSIRERSPDVVAAEPHVGDADTLAPLADLLDGAARDATLLYFGAPEALPTVRNIRVAAIGDSDDDERVAATIGAAAARAVARREDRALRTTIAEHKFEVFEGIVGVSPVIRKIIERIRKAAGNKLTVLILGETGVGKDLIAEAIHRQSDRASRPFKRLNCAGLNENLLESELFGHVKGAFTGAVADRKGYFVAADGGTLFLDEIGDMPLTLQAKLLLALERREITPVGSTEVRRIDVRIIAATNADLHRLVDEKRFRDDLYYRLHQWEIKVPPLRERREDVPVLADFFRQRANRNHGVSCPSISSEAMHLLTKYLWPGNVRELANTIEVLVVEVSDRQIEADDLPDNIRGTRDIVLSSAAGGIGGLTLNQLERMAIEVALKATSGNREQTAKMLGIGTRTLYRKIKEYGL